MKLSVSGELRKLEEARNTATRDALWFLVNFIQKEVPGSIQLTREQIDAIWKELVAIGSDPKNNKRSTLENKAKEQVAKIKQLSGLK